MYKLYQENKKVILCVSPSGKTTQKLESRTSFSLAIVGEFC